MINNWLRVFLYHLKTKKLFSVLNVLGLSIGITGLLFSILNWNDEHEYDQWNPGKEKVFQVMSEIKGETVWAKALAPYEAYLKTTFPELEEYCYFSNAYGSIIVAYKEKKEIVEKTIDAQANFFSFFPFEFIYGDPQTAVRDKNSIALSEQTAKNIFGDQDPMGKSVNISGQVFVVRGVYRIPGKSSIAPAVVMGRIDERLRNFEKHWGSYNFSLMLKLKNPSDAGLISERLDQIYDRNGAVSLAREAGISHQEFTEKYGQTKIILQPLKTARLHAIVSGYPEGRGNYLFLIIMFGVSMLILVLSVVNYVNLATGNAVNRAKEVGVRKVTGATKTNIVWQFVFETCLTVLVAVLLALTIAELLLPYYNELLDKELVMHEGQFFLQLVLVFFLVVVLAGIFPAVYVANFETLKVLKGNFGRSKKGVWIRNGMLVLQFIIASFFITGSYVVYRQVRFMSSKDLGFEGDQVIDIAYRKKGDRSFNKCLTLKDELLKIKGVRQVGISGFSFGTGEMISSGFQYKGANIQCKNMGVDFSTLEMMDIKIKEGRSFRPEYASDTINSILINETAARRMNEDKPVGKEIVWDLEKYKIIGVVKDFHIYGFQEEVPPMIFFHFKTVDWQFEANMNRLFVKITPENMDETIAEIEGFWLRNVNSDYPFQYDFVNKKFARTYKAFVNQKNLFSLLNVIVILIAVFGLFALASYSIQRRMKEIAIRKTLGAETNALLRELSKQYIVFCAAGFIIALVPTYYLIEEWLQNFAYRVTVSMIPFLVCFLLLMAITLAVVLSRAYLATRVDVLKYLKYE